MRIELTTFSLATRCSTAELHPQISVWAIALNRGRYYKYPLFRVKHILSLKPIKHIQSLNDYALKVHRLLKNDWKSLTSKTLTLKNF